jgi:hypothetical protein
MSPISKNERKVIYEQAARELDEATAAHEAALANHQHLVNRINQANLNFEFVEAAMEDGLADFAEFDAANEEWGEAQNALDAATRETLDALERARLQAYRTYEDYIA